VLFCLLAVSSAGVKLCRALGDGTLTDSPVPVDVNGISGAVSLTVGSYHTCAVLSDGSVKCWGLEMAGQLGTGTNSSDSSVPVNVPGISGAVQVSGGGFTSCVVLLTGNIKCWGENSYGQLGNGTSNNISYSPTSVQNISNAASVHVGNDDACALLATGNIKCWGANRSGQLGNGSTSDSSIPVAVSGIDNAMLLATGGGHSCALLDTGKLKCWGDNSYGQLGDGSTTNALTPVEVSGLAGIVDISLSTHSCVVLSSGSVMCWGSNEFGQLGNGTTTNSLTPIAVIGISNAVSVAAGYDHTCAVLSDSSIKCWERSRKGSLAMAQ